ncbi:hypothetical protein A2U01_0114926, partial [Trifolium medium]|nr:hypothetical protein [Trifolium medium]
MSEVSRASSCDDLAMYAGSASGGLPNTIWN